MSEFKFACPVCGQHMACDTSQGGTVMECPTCFQQIVAPQASGNAKFILTGQKFVERKAADPAGSGTGNQPARRKKNPLVIAVVLAAVLVAGFFAYYEFGGAWLNSDIGAVGVAGTFHDTAGTLVINGGGADIWGQADAFRFAHQTLNGDGTLTARIEAVQNTDPWAKAGLMIRQSLSPDSVHVLASVSATSGILLQQRDHPANAAAVVQMVPGQGAPCWLRLTRRGNIFTAASSADGKTWTTFGTTTIAMNNPVLAGLAVCSHVSGTLCRAKFDSVSLETP